MTKNDKVPAQPQTQPPALRVDEVAQQKQKAEQKEIAGRHKNDGPHDHKVNQGRGQ